MASETNARDALDVLACEIELRPVGAPGFDAVANSVLDVQRDGERTLAVAFDPATAEAVEAYAAAERACCSSLQWMVERDERSTRLVISAAPAQVDVLETLFRQPP